jgi:hypothetical protein
VAPCDKPSACLISRAVPLGLRPPPPDCIQQEWAISSWPTLLPDVFPGSSALNASAAAQCDLAATAQAVFEQIVLEVLCHARLHIQLRVCHFPPVGHGAAAPATYAEHTDGRIGLSCERLHARPSLRPSAVR